MHLIADAGFDNYQTTINISRKMVDEKKDVVQRFVNATLEGWARYMKGGQGDRGGERPDQEGQPRHGRREDRLRDQGDERAAASCISGDALTLGIGAMTDERWKRFYETMARCRRRSRPGSTSRKAYSLDFVNKGVGKA